MLALTVAHPMVVVQLCVQVELTRFSYHSYQKNRDKNIALSVLVLLHNKKKII